MADVKGLTQGFEIKDKVCAVIGLGGLGTNVAVHLAGAGVSRAHLCIVQSSGLSRLLQAGFHSTHGKLY